VNLARKKTRSWT